MLGSWPSRPLAEGPLELPYCDNVTCVGLEKLETEKMRDYIVIAFETPALRCMRSQMLVPVLLRSKRSDGRYRSRRVGDKVDMVRGALLWLAQGAVVTGRQV